VVFRRLQYRGRIGTDRFLNVRDAPSNWLSRARQGMSKPYRFTLTIPALAVGAADKPLNDPMRQNSLAVACRCAPATTHPHQSTSRCGLPKPTGWGHARAMGTKSREQIYGSSIRASAERAKEARKEADRLACEAWNQRMLGYKGPAQPSPTLGDALNAGFIYLEVRCLGCDTHQTVALNIVRRPKTTPIHELERYMRCKDCSEVRAYPYKRSHLVALRPKKISANGPPSTWWPDER
jgi:hypothetical protein